MKQGRVRDWRGIGLRCLVPVMPWRDLPRLVGYTILGAALGGIYGVLHDQLTYTIGPEYFTRLKFDQFAAMRIRGGEDRGSLQGSSAFSRPGGSGRSWPG
jgi:hypothetical protein